MTASTTAERLGRWVRTFKPVRPTHRWIELARGGIGGLLGIIIASAFVRAVGIGVEGLPYIVAPIGASAVLVFAVPASPLAQPFPVLFGNTLSAAVGIASAKVFDDKMVAAAVAVGAAILLMMIVGCVHPPGGACALFAAVGAPVIQRQGFAFALWPVAANTAALIVVAILVNNLTGRHYPHVAAPAPTTTPTDVVPTERVGVQTADVAAAMQHLDEGYDIMPGDVVTLIHDAETYALQRRLGQLHVGDIMAREVRTVSPEDSLYRARTLMNQLHIKALPVVDDDGRLRGIVAITDLFNLDVADLTPVASVMTGIDELVAVTPDAPVAELVGLMADRGFRHIPVVDAGGRLTGIVTQAELIAILHRALLTE